MEINTAIISRIIRKQSGLTSRAAFAKKYNIPLRTLENWDAGQRRPAVWELDLLARVVLDDFIPPFLDSRKFYIAIIGDHDEDIQPAIASYSEAVTQARAMDNQLQDAGDPGSIELRIYESDPFDEDILEAPEYDTLIIHED